MAIFPPFFFLGNIGQQNVFYDILERKNGFLGFKNKKFKQSKNWHISKGVNPSFSSKNGHFSKNCSLGNIAQENFFYGILDRKNGFLGYKNKKFKKSKNWYFSKGVNPWFWSKSAHFSNFFCLGNIRQGNVFYDTLERKNAFLGYIKKKFKKSKNWHFSKSPKMAICQTFFFQQYRPGKYILRYSRTKKRLSCFYSLERPFFVLEYHKRHLPGLYCLKKKWRNGHFWTKTMG